MIGALAARNNLRAKNARQPKPWYALTLKKKLRTCRYCHGYDYEFSERK